MVHNGVSSKAPYFDEAVRVEVALHGRAFIWSPACTGEQWLIPSEWVREVRAKHPRTGKETVTFEVDQDGAVGGRLISLPRDRIEIVR